MEFQEFQKYNASLYTGKQTQINIYNFNINTINQQITYLQESVSGILKQKRVFFAIGSPLKPTLSFVSRTLTLTLTFLIIHYLLLKYENTIDVWKYKNVGYGLIINSSQNLPPNYSNVICYVSTIVIRTMK